MNIEVISTASGHTTHHQDSLSKLTNFDTCFGFSHVKLGRKSTALYACINSEGGN